MGMEKNFCGNPQTPPYAFRAANGLEKAYHNFVPKAKRVILSISSCRPSQLELFRLQAKVKLTFTGKSSPIPWETGSGSRGKWAQTEFLFPMTPLSRFQFSQIWSEQGLGQWTDAHTQEIVDRLCFNQEHADWADQPWSLLITFSRQAISFQAPLWELGWVMALDRQSKPTLPYHNGFQKCRAGSNRFYSRLWGNGFATFRYQGNSVFGPARPSSLPRNPENYEREGRPRMLNYLKSLNEAQFDTYGDPEISARIAQYEMAPFRMQTFRTWSYGYVQTNLNWV